MTITPNPKWRGDPTFLPEVLKAFGLEVATLDGWDQRGHGDFTIIQGIMIHHIGSNKFDPWGIARHPQLGLCSQIHLARSGKVTLCGVGIAYHAGKGSFRNWATNNANFASIGVEAESDGVTAWPAAQMDAYHRLCAAILWFLGKRATTDTLLSHWEYSLTAQGKWDPGAGAGHGPRWAGDTAAMLNMETFRAKVNHYIDNPPFQAVKEKPVAINLDTVVTTSSGTQHPLWKLLVWTDGRVFELERKLQLLDQGQFNRIEKKLDQLLEVKNGAR